MGNFDVTTPAGSDLLSQGDDNIRGFKTAIQEALRAGAVAGDNIEGVEAIFPGASPSTAPVYRYRGLKDTTGNRPTAGQYGLFFDTTRNVLQRDNGTSWDDVGAVIPSGTKMVFYQASAPVGWTAVALNDKFLRVVTAGGTGGSTGGTVAASTSLAHTHTVDSHTHTQPAHTHTTPNHQHYLFYTAGTENQITESNSFIGKTRETDGDGARFKTYSGTTGSSFNTREYTHAKTQTDGNSVTGSSGSDVTGAATPATDSQLGAFAYADIIICSKD